MDRSGILRVIGTAVLHPVFGKREKENGMPASAMVWCTDRNRKDLRELASKRGYRP